MKITKYDFIEDSFRNHNNQSVIIIWIPSREGWQNGSSPISATILLAINGSAVYFLEMAGCCTCFHAYVLPLSPE